MNTKLKKQYDFEIIPDCPAATSAGYSAADRQHSQLFDGPTYDGDYFYYSAYFGNPLYGVVKSSILVCRRKIDGSLVYATNCQDYTLDTGNNMVGNNYMICRPAPVIKGNRLYLVSSWLSNIGSQLFCIDKLTGNKIYSIAYHLPYEVEQKYNTKQITTIGDYSEFCGSNARINNMRPVVRGNKIWLGTSSYQNFINPGMTFGSIHYTGYPYSTDQGCLTCVKEIGNTAIFLHRTFNCALELRTGDRITKSSNDYNPFLPNSTTVLIGTITKDTITSPGAINGIYNFAQKLTITSAPVSQSNFAPFWTTVGKNIYVNNSVNGIFGPYTLTEVILYINQGLYTGIITITVATTNVSSIVNTQASGDMAVWYVKKLKDHDIIQNKYDANALNYWGNDIWGGSPSIVGNTIIYGTGQTHSAPLDEKILFSRNEYNYAKLKIPLVDLTNRYADNQTVSNLLLLNKAKVAFNERMKDLSCLNIRSPRGQASYGSAVMSASLSSGALFFGVRSIPHDIYDFLGSTDPSQLIGLPSVGVDGDLSSGVHIHENIIVAVGKHGGLITINLDGKQDTEKWDHTQPNIGIETSTYTGTNTILGGTNYHSTFRDNRRKPMLLALTANANAGGDSIGSDGRPEKYVTKQGLVVEKGISLAYCFDLDERDIIWATPLLSNGFGTASLYHNCLLTCDIIGHLYSININNGNLNWIKDSSSDPHPMLGGVASPTIDDETSQVFWIASYNFPGQVISSGNYGWVLIPDES